MPEHPTSPSETPVARMLTCLQEVGSNVAFIRQELPGLEMPAEHRGAFLKICASFAEDLDRLQGEVEQLPGESPPGSGAIEAIQGRIGGQVTKVDEWVKAARALAAAEPGCVVVKILIEESGANMLRAYVAMWDTLELLRKKT